MTTTNLNPDEEVMRWKLVASYLASCHAATLEGLPKSAAKSERKRLVEICRKAALFLRGLDVPHPVGIQSASEQIEWDTKRCENASTTHDVRPVVIKR